MRNLFFRPMQNAYFRHQIDLLYVHTNSLFTKEMVLLIIFSILWIFNRNKLFYSGKRIWGINVAIPKTNLDSRKSWSQDSFLGISNTKNTLKKHRLWNMKQWKYFIPYDCDYFTFWSLKKNMIEIIFLKLD